MSDDEKRAHTIEELVVQNIMKTEGGRDFMMKHLRRCGVFESIFNEDPIRHAKNAGLREAGLMLERDLKELAPAYYIKMIEENIDG